MPWCCGLLEFSGLWYWGVLFNKKTETMSVGACVEAVVGKRQWLSQDVPSIRRETEVDRKD